MTDLTVILILCVGAIFGFGVACIFGCACRHGATDTDRPPRPENATTRCTDGVRGYIVRGEE